MKRRCLNSFGVGMVSAMLLIPSGMLAGHRYEVANSSQHFFNLLDASKHALVVFYQGTDMVGEVPALLDAYEVPLNTASQLAVVDNLSQKPRYRDVNMDFIAVDVSNEDMAMLPNKYQIMMTNQPVFVLFDHAELVRTGYGRHIAKMSGFSSQNDLESFIEKFFADDFDHLTGIKTGRCRLTRSRRNSGVRHDYYTSSPRSVTYYGYPGKYWRYPYWHSN